MAKSPTPIGQLPAPIGPRHRPSVSHAHLLQGTLVYSFSWHPDAPLDDSSSARHRATTAPGYARARLRQRLEQRGVISVTVHRADDLRGVDPMPSKAAAAASKAAGGDEVKMTSDPYVVVSLGDAEQSTKVVPRNTSPSA